MGREEIRRVLKEILQGVNSFIDYEQECALVDGRQMNSIDLVCIITEVEERLGIEIPYHLVKPEFFNSLDAMTDMLLALKQKQEV